MMVSAIAALVVGAALATAGATLQSVLRNPLAEPYMLGLVGGASLFTALAVHFGLEGAGAFVLPVAGFMGSVFSLSLVCGISYVASKRRGGAAFAGETVILAGFVAGSFTGSLYMLVMSFAEPATFARLSKWLFGDLRSVRPAALAVASVCAAAAFVAVYSQSRALDALSLGETMARTLGVNVRRTRLVALGAASLATAASVALAGAIGFLGLVVPHVVRRLFGANHRAYLPLSAMFGALFLLAAHGVSGKLPKELSAGVVCALCGSPFFLYLLCLRRGAECPRGGR